MKTMSLKLPDELHEQVRRLAEQRGQSKSELVRTALEQFLGGGNGTSKPMSALELAGDLVGSCQGPGDLSTNKQYLEDFGK